MTPEQFTYWLQGFVELGKGAAPNPEQWKSILEHLDTVFKKVTPAVGDVSQEKTPASGIDWKKIAEDLAKQTHQTPARQQDYPSYPQQPYWLQPGTGVTYPVNPMITTC